MYCVNSDLNQATFCLVFSLRSSRMMTESGNTDTKSDGADHLFEGNDVCFHWIIPLLIEWTIKKITIRKSKIIVCIFWIFSAAMATRLVYFTLIDLHKRSHYFDINLNLYNLDYTCTTVSHFAKWQIIRIDGNTAIYLIIPFITLFITYYTILWLSVGILSLYWNLESQEWCSDQKYLER